MSRPDPKPLEIPDYWRIGFEVEVVLGDLNDPRFVGDEFMDIADARYCQAVASELTRLTGEKWTAPRVAKSKPGFYVLPEYDIDPIEFEHFAEGVAGVELLTPPLSPADAEDMRCKIRDAVATMEGYDNFDLNERLGWHINIDSLKDNNNRENAFKYAAGVDEIPMLAGSGRLGTQLTGLQRHAFGPLLLREMQAPHAIVRPDVNFYNFVEHYHGASKRYAANFARQKYLELRHYAAADFFSKAPLNSLIGNVIQALEMDHASKRECGQRLFETFECLKTWLFDHSPKLDLATHAPGITSANFADLIFDTHSCGLVSVDGTMSVQLWDGMDDYTCAGAWGHLQSNLDTVFATLCLDLAELYLLQGEPEEGTSPLFDAVGELGDKLQSSGLLERPEIVRADWWMVD